MDLSKLIPDFLKLLHGLVNIETWIALCCYMDFSKLIHGFVKVVTWIPRPSQHKTKLKFDHDFKVS